MSFIYKKSLNNESRYILGKINNTNAKTLICFGINPSTATPEKLDGTINKIKNIANYNNYENWIVLNVYPQRATSPKDLHYKAHKFIAIKNIYYIRKILKNFKNASILLAYGNVINERPYLKKYLKKIYRIIKKSKLNTFIISLTKENNPIHPLYQKNNSQLVIYNI